MRVLVAIYVSYPINTSYMSRLHEHVHTYTGATQYARLYMTKVVKSILKATMMWQEV